MKKKWFPAILAAAMLAGAFCAQAEEEREIKTLDPTALLKYELTEEGTLTEEDRFNFMRDAILVGDGDDVAILSIKGEPIENGLQDVESLGGGLYKIRQAMEEDDVNKTGLVTDQGEILIPCEAASIITPSNREEDGFRFLEVIYATEETETEEDCIIYFTQSMFSFSVGEDDVMYKGYAKIFDVQRGQFVEGVEFDQSNRYGFYDLGDAFALEHGDVTTMYDPDGNQIWETDGYITGDTYHALCVSVGSDHFIVDASGKEVFASDNSITDCIKSTDYFEICDWADNNPYHIIDLNGDPVMEDGFAIVYNSTPNNFYVKIAEDDENEKTYVLAADGSVIAENIDVDIPVLGGYGYIELENTEDPIVVTPASWYDGVQEDYSSRLLFLKNEHPLILNTGEELELPADAYLNAIAPGLLSVEDTTLTENNTGLYDLFTGEQILETKYERIEKAGNYVLARTTDSSGTYTWDVFRCELVAE